MAKIKFCGWVNSDERRRPRPSTSSPSTSPRTCSTSPSTCPSTCSSPSTCSMTHMRPRPGARHSWTTPGARHTCAQQHTHTQTHTHTHTHTRTHTHSTTHMCTHKRACACILTHAHALPGVNAPRNLCRKGLNIYFEAPGLLGVTFYIYL